MAASRRFHSGGCRVIVGHGKSAMARQDRVMRRADRLFQIVQHFRGGRLVTAQKLSQWLEVSERTIYRDIADLQATGVPIDGEAGVGYLMREGFDLPPLMFTRDEIVALVAGARMVRAFGGAAMARAADEALVKIGAVLPDAEKDRIARTEIHTPMWVVSDAARAAIDIIERAVEKRDVLTLDYRDEAGRPTARDVRPLGLWFWGKVWTLVAWCEMRDDFRAFRIDRIDRLTLAGRSFRHERGKQLADFYRSIERGQDTAYISGGSAGS
jgi:predicted DNA-binding transcriptional regulator YafY